MGAWLCQGNERDRFPISEYLRIGYNRKEEIQWLIGKDSMPIRAGERVFMWRTEGGRPGTGGVVAIGSVSRVPHQAQNDVPEMWYDSEDPGATDSHLWRIRMLLEEVRLTPDAGMVRRVDLKGDPDLRDLCILKRSQGVSCCAVTDRHERALLERWNAKKSRR